MVTPGHRAVTIRMTDTSRPAPASEPVPEHFSDLDETGMCPQLRRQCCGPSQDRFPTSCKQISLDLSMCMLTVAIVFIMGGLTTDVLVLLAPFTSVEDQYWLLM